MIQNLPLKENAASVIMPPTPPPYFDWHKFAEMQVQVLQTQLNYWRAQLGYNPKRCPHCGEVLK